MGFRQSSRRASLRRVCTTSSLRSCALVMHGLARCSPDSSSASSSAACTPAGRITVTTFRPPRARWIAMSATSWV